MLLLCSLYSNLELLEYFYKFEMCYFTQIFFFFEFAYICIILQYIIYSCTASSLLNINQLLYYTFNIAHASFCVYFVKHLALTDRQIQV